jgi:hypothetical protein
MARVGAKVYLASLPPSTDAIGVFECKLARCGSFCAVFNSTDLQRPANGGPTFLVRAVDVDGIDASSPRFGSAGSASQTSTPSTAQLMMTSAAKL